MKPVQLATGAQCHLCGNPLSVFDLMPGTSSRCLEKHRYAAVCAKCRVGLEFVVVAERGPELRDRARDVVLLSFSRDAVLIAKGRELREDLARLL